MFLKMARLFTVDSNCKHSLSAMEGMQPKGIRGISFMGLFSSINPQIDIRQGPVAVLMHTDEHRPLKLIA